MAIIQPECHQPPQRSLKFQIRGKDQSVFGTQGTTASMLLKCTRSRRHLETYTIYTESNYINGKSDCTGYLINRGGRLAQVVRVQAHNTKVASSIPTWAKELCPLQLD
ncbi:uncharacterized protein RBU33_003456 isoform 1-T1 [Hipposideros larvatus]